MERAPPGDRHRDTLRQIDDFVNDIEMRPPLAELAIWVVIDTNILLHHFEVLSQFVADVEKEMLPVIIVVPGVVIHELDGQKNRDGLAWFARRASAWLLMKIKERKTVKGQTNDETCQSTGNWKIQESGITYLPERRNDALILDCCLYFKTVGRTLLCSADVNLCIEGCNQGIEPVTPSKQWSSRELAQGVYDVSAGVAFERFAQYQVSYCNLRRVIKAAPYDADADEDRMNVDDVGPVPEVLLPSHALDLLHVQVVDLFSRLLIQQVGHVVQPEEFAAGDSDTNVPASQHHPRSRRRATHYTRWTAADCLEYLNEKRPVKATSPRLENFLSIPYARGARRGQDWSRRDWEIALESLAAIGDSWKNGSFRESLNFLLPHMNTIFSQKMKPTGFGSF